MTSYRYFSGAEGRCFCYAAQPTFICPYSQLKYGTASEEREVPGAFTRAAKVLDVFPDSLVRMVVRAHRNNQRARDAQGKLTDRCDSCGHRMERRGFRCWIERPWTPADGESLSAEMTRAFGGKPTVIEKTVYMETKREAVEWAREEAELSRATAKGE